MIPDYSKHKKLMRIIAIPLIVIGLIICIYGFTSFGTGDFEDSQLSGLLFIGGFGITAVGLILLFMSLTRPIGKYYATELSPAMRITGESVGKGLKESGFGKSETKEVIKVKCPHCGYLESEDADFCSKCGKKI